MSKSTLKILPVLMVAVTAALVTQPVFSQAPAPTPHDLEFTENSSTDLSVTYDGVIPVVDPLNTSADHWIVAFPITLIFSLNQSPAWFEPGTFTQENFVLIASSGLATVVSDNALVLTPFPDEFPVVVGFDTTDQVPIFATFDDDGDVATVPETGSSFGLLFLSLIALLGANRLRSQKLIA